MKSILTVLCLLVASIANATHPSTTTTTLPADSCEQRVTSNPEAYCGAYVEAEANSRATAICGDCKNLSLYAAITNTKVACQNSQENSNAASSYCGNAEQSCGDMTANVTCPPAPECPDLQSACAQWKYRYNSKGKLISQKCKRWVVPVAFPSN